MYDELKYFYDEDFARRQKFKGHRNHVTGTCQSHFRRPSTVESRLSCHARLSWCSLSAIPVHNVSGNCTRSGICCVTCNFPAISPTASSYWHIDAIATNNINNWKRDSYMSPPPTTTSLFTFTFPLFFTIFAISLSSSNTLFLLHNSTS